MKGLVVIMLCCVVAACLVVKIMVRRRVLARYLGFTVRDEEERYGYFEHGELDVYKS
jgi:hypothetical protein